MNRRPIVYAALVNVPRNSSGAFDEVLIYDHGVRMLAQLRYAWLPESYAAFTNDPWRDNDMGKQPLKAGDFQIGEAVIVLGVFSAGHAEYPGVVTRVHRAGHDEHGQYVIVDVIVWCSGAIGAAPRPAIRLYLGQDEAFNASRLGQPNETASAVCYPQGNGYVPVEQLAKRAGVEL